MFLHLSVILLTGGPGVVAAGGHARFLRGGDMRGCSGGVCVVALGVGGHAWLLPWGCAWLLQGGHAWSL